MADEISTDITPLGLYNFRNQRKKFGVKVDDRRRHIYIVGKTGVGKTTLLKNMMIADIQAGKGVAVLDPHGEFAESLLDYVPESRINDVIYFNPSDMAYPIAFNPMEQVNSEFRHLVASGIMGVFKKIWPDAWSARMEYILNNTLLALLEFPDTTLLGVMRMFADKEYRKLIVANLKDPVIQAFWRDEFAAYTQRLESEALAAIQNKVGQLVSNPLIRNILGQARSTLNMREIMDSGKILIVNLSKGRIGEDNSALLGAMIITRLQLAAMSRVDIQNEDDRRDFFVYVDEFQNFATDSFASILSEARKYRLSMVLAHQYIGQLTAGESTKVRDAIFGNVGTIITFRVGATDAEFLEKEFMPEFLQTDLVNLPRANIYIRLMIDGLASQPFSAETLPPAAVPLVSYRDVIIKNSEEHYGTPRAVVEKRIASQWEGQSAASAEEKITRRDEKRLSDVLRPGAPLAQRRPATPPAQHDAPSSRPSEAPSWSSPRVASIPSSANMSASAARLVKPPVANNNEQRGNPIVERPVEAAPMREERKEATKPPSVAVRQPEEKTQAAAPANPMPAKEQSPSPQRMQNSSQKNESPAQPERQAQAVAPSAMNKEMPKVPPQSSAVLKESLKNNEESMGGDIMLREFIKSRGETKPEKADKPKQFNKTPVDISALRKSITMSLGKTTSDKKDGKTKENIDTPAEEIKSTKPLVQTDSRALTVPPEPAEKILKESASGNEDTK